MYCSHCGKEIEDTDICPLCGCYARNAGQAPAAPAAAPVAAKPALKPSKTPVIVIAGISLLFTIIAEVCYALKVFFVEYTIIQIIIGLHLSESGLALPATRNNVALANYIVYAIVLPLFCFFL